MSPCIMISDTHAASRRMLRFAMNLKGCSVVECVDPSEVMDLLAGRRIDLLLLSLYPFDQGAYRLLETLRERFTPARQPLVLIGDNQLRAGLDPQLAQEAAWLDRPFQASALLALVDGLLTRGALSPVRQKQ